MIDVDYGMSPDLPPSEDMRPAERAYLTIRAAILSGELEAGAHLGEEQLAAMCGSSRTPVREALQRLTAEGLALAEGRRRFVADLSYDEIAVIFDLRARMEAYAASVAARRITGPQTDRLELLVDEMDALVSRPPADAAHDFLSLNGAFHGGILAATRSAQIRSMTAQAFSVPLVTLKRHVCRQEINLARSNIQHREILGALRAKDPEWASVAMMGHILATKPTREDAAQGARAKAARAAAPLPPHVHGGAPNGRGAA